MSTICAYQSRESRFSSCQKCRLRIPKTQLEGQNNTPDNNNLVGFVDSDDVISKNYFCNLVFSMQAHNVKIAKCSDVAIFDTNHYNAKTFRIRQRQTKGLAWQFKHNKITKAEV